MDAVVNNMEGSIKDYAVWVITLVIVGAGFKYAKAMMVFMLQKLYQFFIQHNTNIIN